MRTGVPGRSNGAALTMLVVLLVLLPLLISLVLAQDERRKTGEDRSLTFEASEQAANVADYFARSRALTQILAHNPTFAEFYEHPGERSQKIRAEIRSIRQANDALAHLERLFPGSIGEACFIDASGPENARAVRGRVEPMSKLSRDETGAPFFAPTFAIEPGHVYQSRPYVSPDTNEWVIANSAPIELPGRPTPAIVHFEITLESLRRAAGELSELSDVQIVDARSRLAILDTRYRFVDEDLPPGLRAMATALPRSGALEMRGLMTVNGQRVAYQRLPADGENANDWIVVARARTSTAGWAGTVNPWQWALFAGIASLIPLTFVGWRRSQSALTRAARTDGLTGLGNRRLLADALEHATSTATPDHPFLLAVYDLDGFKLYNDTYGHPAGDALLTRLAQRLDSSVHERAHTYRMGGDEFCVITALESVDESLEVAVQAADALSDRGEGFAISASYGAVLLPIETRDATEALRIADQRMYAQKSSSRMSAPRQTTDVLVQMIEERNPEFGEHISVVVRLAAAVSERLRLPREEIDEIQRVAALHDIGKLAIPESILMKPGPLVAAEQEFMRQHTVIGERILSAAPSLFNCAKIVRSSHERWDGAGYPDGLAGEAIPHAARIVAVCDAYHAMTSMRPYRDARSAEDALEELQRCAGTQFDPSVVQAFVAELRSEQRPTSIAV